MRDQIKTYGSGPDGKFKPAATLKMSHLIQVLEVLPYYNQFHIK
jgi:hypothetical protein